MILTVDPIIISCICAAIALVAAIIIITTIIVVKKKKQSKRIKIDEEFINGLLDIMGSKDNISNVNVDNGRLKIEVKDLDSVKLEALKGISTSGVFVTGNIIKVLFKLDSLDIKKALDKRLYKE